MSYLVLRRPTATGVIFLVGHDADATVVRAVHGLELIAAPRLGDALIRRDLTFSAAEHLASRLNRQRDDLEREA